MHVIRRDPALFTSFAATGIRLITAFALTLTVDQQSAVNATVAAAAGLLVAYAVKDGQVAAILGVVQALLALALGFGLEINPEEQALIMSFVGTGIAMFVRTQVTASAPPVH